MSPQQVISLPKRVIGENGAWSFDSALRLQPGQDRFHTEDIVNYPYTPPELPGFPADRNFTLDVARYVRAQHASAILTAHPRVDSISTYLPLSSLPLPCVFVCRINPSFRRSAPISIPVLGGEFSDWGHHHRQYTLRLTSMASIAQTAERCSLYQPAAFITGLKLLPVQSRSSLEESARSHTQGRGS